MVLRMLLIIEWLNNICEHYRLILVTHHHCIGVLINLIWVETELNIVSDPVGLLLYWGGGDGANQGAGWSTHMQS